MEFKNIDDLYLDPATAVANIDSFFAAECQSLNFI